LGLRFVVVLREGYTRRRERTVYSGALKERKRKRHVRPAEGLDVLGFDEERQDGEAE
jgi:hypothetical protein